MSKNPAWVRISRVLPGLAFCLSLSGPGQSWQTVHAADAVAVPTMSFQSAVPLQAAGKPAALQKHVTTRCFDWDSDGDQDLLVGGGDGRLWLLLNSGTTSTVQLESPVPVTAGQLSSWGKSYTGAVLVNLVGNDRPDLVVCHSGNQITMHENTGTAARPAFAESGLSVTVQDNCQGRFDVADWDGDGRLDLITGSFGGRLMWQRNTGPAGQPEFAPGQPFSGITLAYNVQPRLLDFNQDGRLDLLLGVNWGTVSLYLNTGTGFGTAAYQPRLKSSVLLRWADDGSTLNIRSLNGDDTTPELVDLNGDGVLDLISGGKNGRLFQMQGVGFESRVATFRELLTEHGDRLGQRLREDAAVRDAAFGALAALQADLAAGLIPARARETVFTQLAPLAAKFPDVLQRTKWDLTDTPHLPMLAAQYWVVLLEALSDSAAGRQRIADALDFQGGYRQLLTEFGVLFIDNNTATAQHLDAMQRLISAIPRQAWEVDIITVAGWLGAASRTHRIRSRTGINIFDLPLGRRENSFAGDAPRPGVTDVYMICLAHELAHNMLDTVGRRTRPELFERKFAGLAQAAGPHVVFRTPKARGIDMAATQQTFRQNGFWDGEKTTWQAAWSGYFKGKTRFDRAYTRGNIHFFLNSPQEAFATLANQYFADSQLMLEFCRGRWEDGHRSNVNQFVLICEYLSGGSDRVPFYVLRPGGDLTVEQVDLVRDSQQRIVQVRSERSVARFEYAAEDLVSSFQLTASP